MRNNRGLELKNILWGFGFSLIISGLGFVLYIQSFTKLSLFEDFNIIVKSGNLGKLIALGTLPNILLFTYLINNKKEAMAKGCIVEVMLITVVTFLLNTFL